MSSMATARRAAFIEACDARRTRPGDDAHVGAGAGVLTDSTPSAIERARPAPFADRSIAGSASAELVDTIGRYAELGFDEFIVPDFNLGSTPERRRESLERIEQEVIRQL